MIRIRPWALASALLLIAALVASPTLASVTPAPYGKWKANQEVPFMWNSKAAPPSWLRPAILAAVADSASSRGSRAATFKRVNDAKSYFAYTGDVCTTAAIACAYNNAPNTFWVKLRLQGWSFDWGKLRWCQFEDKPKDGCFDAETITLHELGHVQGLGHTTLDASDAGWALSIMHKVARAKPKFGWNAHEFRPCDVAALQVHYRPMDSHTPISTCLSLPTTTTLSTSATSVAYRGSVTFTATLATSSDVSYSKLRNLPLSARTVVLQRRLIGGSWSNFATFSPTSTDGTYRLTFNLSATADWRAVFAAPSSEGLLGSTSAAVRVTVAECTSSCPLSMPADGDLDQGGNQ